MDAVCTLKLSELVVIFREVFDRVFDKGNLPNVLGKVPGEVFVFVKRRSDNPVCYFDHPFLVQQVLIEHIKPRISFPAQDAVEVVDDSRPGPSALFECGKIPRPVHEIMEDKVKSVPRMFIQRRGKCREASDRAIRQEHLRAKALIKFIRNERVHTVAEPQECLPRLLDHLPHSAAVAFAQRILIANKQNIFHILFPSMNTPSLALGGYV